LSRAIYSYTVDISEASFVELGLHVAPRKKKVPSILPLSAHAKFEQSVFGQLVRKCTIFHWCIGNMIERKLADRIIRAVGKLEAFQAIGL